jgi:hypothetical protein
MSRVENVDIILPVSIALSLASSDPPQSFPAQPAVYALLDASRRPLLLATTADLRHALRRRLSPDSRTTDDAPRIDYRSITREVRYRRVGSAFAANWWYYRSARAWFPDHYRGMLGWRDAWFIHVNPDESFPHFQNGTNPTGGVDLCWGPLPSRSSSQTLIHALEDIFDLCRYYEIFRQAPHARACAYKDMGKCPAPCDGSITVDAYRARIREAVEFLSTSTRRPDRPASTRSEIGTFSRDGGAAAETALPWRRGIEQAMRAAARRMDFHLAAHLQDKLRRFHELEDPAFTHLRCLDQWAYLAIERGRTAHWIEPFLVEADRIEPWPEVAVPDVASACARWATRIARRATVNRAAGRSVPTQEVVRLLAHHLFRRGETGLYIPVGDDTDAPTLASRLAGWLKKRKTAEIVDMNIYNTSTADRQKPGAVL